MNELETALIHWYGVKANRIESFMDGYVIRTGDSEKYFRKNFFSAGRILFIHGAKEHLANKGLNNIDRYIPALNGDPYIEFHGELCTLTERYSGRECDFFEIDDILKATRVVAQMHLASSGYEIETGDGSFLKNVYKEPSPVLSDREPSPVPSFTVLSPVIRTGLGKLPVLYEKKLRELKKLKNYARRGKTQFDEIYLSVVDKFYDQGKTSLERVSGEAYQRLVERAYKEKIFCHGNLSHKNIVFGEKGIHIKGFEYCRYDIRVMDIVDIIRRRLKKCGWLLDDVAAIVSEYACVDSLCNDELEVIKGMLQFPYRFWELSNRFYNSKRGWAKKSYTPKLAELVANMEQIEHFVERLDDILR